MQGLATIDLVIILAFLALSFGVGMLFTKKAGTSTEEYFLSGRSMPWWLLGVSMAATNFSIDTPLNVSGFIVKYGLPGAWYHWAGGIAAVSAAFFFSRLWRRANVMTDNELIEIRYSGKEAAGLRWFKGIYFGLIINTFILAWVFNALVKVVAVFGNWNPIMVLIVSGGVTMIYTVSGGFYGAIWTDFVQYILAVGGSIALAVLAVMHVGGIDAMISKLEAIHPGQGFVDFTPQFNGEHALMPFSAFLILIGMKWWAHKFSDGGGKHIQRMSAAKNEKHAVFGAFFYSTFTFFLALWPWVLCGLCSVIIFPTSTDPEANYPRMMQQILPPGVLGFCLVGLLSAFMSTVTTHINLGASYFVNDIYRRFLVRKNNEKHYVLVSRLSSIGVMILAMAISLNIKSVGDTWLFVLSFASGAGLTWILRWFWWRVSAYTEATAMIVSAIVATTLKLKFSHVIFTDSLLIITAITTPILLLVTFLTPPTKEETLKNFYIRVQPSILGWKHIIDKYNLGYTPYFKNALGNFLIGVVLLMSSTFGIGVMILKSFWLGLAMMLFSVALTFWLVKRVNGEQTVIDDKAEADLATEQVRLRAAGGA